MIIFGRKKHLYWYSGWSVPKIARMWTVPDIKAKINKIQYSRCAPKTILEGKGQAQSRSGGLVIYDHGWKLISYCFPSIPVVGSAIRCVLWVVDMTLTAFSSREPMLPMTYFHLLDSAADPTYPLCMEESQTVESWQQRYPRLGVLRQRTIGSPSSPLGVPMTGPDRELALARATL